MGWSPASFSILRSVVLVLQTAQETSGRSTGFIAIRAANWIAAPFINGAPLEITQHFLRVGEPLLIRADQLRELCILLFRID